MVEAGESQAIYDCPEGIRRKPLIKAAFFTVGSRLSIGRVPKAVTDA